MQDGECFHWFAVTWHFEFSSYYLYTHWMRGCIWPRLCFFKSICRSCEWGTKETRHKNWAKEIIWAVWICRFTTSHLICIELEYSNWTRSYVEKWMIACLVISALLRLLPATWWKPWCGTVTQVSVSTTSISMSEFTRDLHKSDKLMTWIRAGNAVPCTREWWTSF